MSQTERLHKIYTLLKSNRAVSKAEFLDELDISDSQFKRDLDYLRDRLRAPIIWDRSQRGYRYDPDEPVFNLPGLWFNQSEIFALLAMEHLLENMQPGLLSSHVQPLRDQVRALIESGDHAAEEVLRRIKILPMAARTYQLKSFETVTAGVLSRKRLAITHYSRQRNDTTEREVSPQRLVHYRDNWYLDAWCHLRNAMRSFSVDTIETAKLTDTKAKTIGEKRLDDYFATAYGIFSGKPRAKAKLRFTPERARWVSREIWHPKQSSRFDEEGYYLLEFPYGDDRELIMDILKYGPVVEVLGPKALRQRVQDELIEAVALYKCPLEQLPVE